MVPRIVVDVVGRRIELLVVDGVVSSDDPIFATLVNGAAARGHIVEVTATGPFRAGLDGDPVAVVEYVAGILDAAGYRVVSTDPPRGTYPTPEGSPA